MIDCPMCEGKGKIDEPADAKPEARAFAQDFVVALSRTCATFRAPKRLDSWIIAARRMFVVDERPVEEARSLAKWLFTSQSPEAIFWRANVLCLKTFRKRYTNLAENRAREEKRHARIEGRAQERQRGPAELAADRIRHELLTCALDDGDHAE